VAQSQRKRGAGLEFGRRLTQRDLQFAAGHSVRLDIGAWPLHRPYAIGRRGPPSPGTAARGGGICPLVAVRNRGPIGSWLQSALGVQLVFTRNGAALATAVMSFPLMVRAMRLSLEGVDRGLEDAARTLGAFGWDRFVTITLPLMLPGILAGAVTAFSAALGEFGAVITFVSNIPGETRTLPLALYTALQSPDGEHAAARLACLSVGSGIGRLTPLRVVHPARAPPPGSLMLRVAAAKRRGNFSLNVEFELAARGVVALFGRSGCGKSTVVNIIAGLLDPDAGRIELDGTVLLDTRQRLKMPPERRGIGYVFQDARLFPHLSVAANLRYGQKSAPRAPPM
jgi:ABC-type molybdate transport system permease subunit